MSVGTLIGTILVSSQNVYPWWLLAIAAVLLLVLATVAAHNSHWERSIDRVAQYDGEFRSMTRERFNAARFCLGKGGKQYDVDEVLDFFDSPIGTLTELGFLDDELVYDFFFEWIRGYWSACNVYIEETRRKDDTLWESMVVLHPAICEIHRRKRSKWAKEKLTGGDLTGFLKNLESGAEDILKGEDLTEFLEGEFEYCGSKPANSKTS